MQPNGYVPKRWVPIYPKRGWAYKTMLEHFLHCVETGTAPSLAPEDSALVTDVLVGAYLSMKTNSWVEVAAIWKTILFRTMTPRKSDKPKRLPSISSHNLNDRGG